MTSCLQTVAGLSCMAHGTAGCSHHTQLCATPLSAGRQPRLRCSPPVAYLSVLVADVHSVAIHNGQVPHTCPVARQRHNTQAEAFPMPIVTLARSTGSRRLWPPMYLGMLGEVSVMLCYCGVQLRSWWPTLSHLARNSAAKEPTPPSPTTSTRAALRTSRPCVPTSS